VGGISGEFIWFDGHGDVEIYLFSWGGRFRGNLCVLFVI
jgi:hypothetical protein